MSTRQTMYYGAEAMPDRYRQSDQDLLQMGMELEEEYFKDFTFGEFEEDMVLQYTLEDGTTKRFAVDDLEERPARIWDEPHVWVVRYSVLDEGVLGQVKDVEQEILISEQLRGDQRARYTLAHEMIHAFELSFFASCSGYADVDDVWAQMRRDFLLMKLMEKLTKEEVHRALQEALPHEGFTVLHTPLFALKACDLDKRMGLRPGTVFGYGRGGT